MIIYIDILIGTNFILDWLFLSFTASILHINYKTYRIVIASFIGSLSSLIILIENFHPLLNIAISLITCIVMLLIAFNFEKIAIFLKRCLVLYLINFVYSGVMNIVYIFASPNGMIVKNSVVYYQISPIIFLAFLLISFLALKLFQKFFNKRSPQNLYYKVTLSQDGKYTSFNAFFDSGNSVKEVISMLPVIVCEKKELTCFFSDEILEKLVSNFSEINDINLQKRLRLIPYNALGKSGVVTAILFENVEIKNSDKSTTQKAYIAIVPNGTFNENYSAILPNYIFT